MRDMENYITLNYLIDERLSLFLREEGFSISTKNKHQCCDQCGNIVNPSLGETTIYYGKT